MRRTVTVLLAAVAAMPRRKPRFPAGRAWRTRPHAAPCQTGCQEIRAGEAGWPLRKRKSPRPRKAASAEEQEHSAPDPTCPMRTPGLLERANELDITMERRRKLIVQTEPDIK